MLNISFSLTNTHTETFAQLINCVIDDILLKTMPDVDEARLQFIDVKCCLFPAQLSTPENTTFAHVSLSHGIT